MNETLEELEVIYKPSEDNISTNNPKAEPTCEKKITNVYIAKKKTVFVVVEAGDFLGKIAKDYMALTANDIADINRLEHPDKLKIGQEIVLSSRVYEVQSGDTLGKIAQKDEFAPVDWREIAKANELVAPYSIYVGKKLVIPLARTKQARCYKEIKYVQVTNVSVGDRVHVVTQTQGFKNNESVTNIIKEDKNIVTQPTKNLPVVENDKEKDKIVSIVEPDKKDPTKGLAVSQELEIKPKLDALIYTVKAGDSLSVIAGQYEGVTEDDIYAKNKDKLKDKNSIYVGQKLTIPTQKMEDVTTTQEVKDKLQKEPTKTTEITPMASSVSLPDEEEVEGEVVELTVEPKIVDVYFGTPVKSGKVKPTTQVEIYTFQSDNIISKAKNNQKNIINRYIIPRTTKGDRKATYADALKALPFGTYKAGSTIKVKLSEPVYTYKKIKSTSLFSTVYLVAEVKNFPDDEKIRLEILEQDAVLASKGANVEFIDETKAEVTTVEAEVVTEGKKQYAVAKVKLSKTDEEAKKDWKEKIEKATNKKSHLRVKGTSVGGVCKAPNKNSKKGKKVELLGGCDAAPWMEIAKGEVGTDEVTDRTKVEEYVATAIWGSANERKRKGRSQIVWDKARKKKYDVTDGEMAWCSCFVGWTLDTLKEQGGKSFSRIRGVLNGPEGAINWTNKKRYPNGVKLSPKTKPPYGAILIMLHGSEGHATFVSNYERIINKDKTEELHITALGGNQKNKVSYEEYRFYQKKKDGIYYKMNYNKLTKKWIKKTITHLENYVLPKEYKYDKNINCYYQYDTIIGGTSNEIK